MFLSRENVKSSFSSIKNEEKEDFMVAHVVTLSSENGICLKLNLKQISFSGLRVTTCASPCFGGFSSASSSSVASSSSLSCRGQAGGHTRVK